MNFLLNCGITEEVLKKIIVNNSEQLILDAEWNVERVVESINYLRSLGITNMEKLLINRFDIVLRGEKSLKETMEALEVEKLVEMINEDIKYVYYLDIY